MKPSVQSSVHHGVSLGKNGACYVYTLLPYSLHSPPATNGLAPSVLGIRDLHYALNPAEGPLLPSAVMPPRTPQART